MDIVNIDRKLIFKSDSGWFIRARNKSGGTLSNGDVVILDTTNSTADNVAVTTTTAADDAKVLGVCVNSAADGGNVDVQIFGLHDSVKANGTTAIVVGDMLSSYTAAKIAQKATAGKAGVLGISLTAYAVADSNGVLTVFLLPAGRQDASASVSYGAVGQMADKPFGTANLAGVTNAVARIDHVHDMQLDGDNTLTDTNDNELLRFIATAAAVNDVTFVNAITGTNPKVRATGDDANIGLDLEGKGSGTMSFWSDSDATRREQFRITRVASSVNVVGVRGAATTANPILEAVGTDANISLDINAKGTGVIRIDNGTDPVGLRLMGAAAGFNSTLQDLNGNELLDLQGVASAVNELGIRNSATGTGVQLETRGDDLNIDMVLVAKGTGVFSLDNGTDPVVLKLLGAQGGFNNIISDVNGNELLKLQGVAVAVNELSVVNAISGAVPTISSTGNDANIDIGIVPKGTGAVRFDNATDPVVLRLYGAQGGYNNVLQDANSNELVTLQGVASAVNQLAIKNSVTTAAPELASQGDDLNISLRLNAKGTGSVVIDNDTDPVVLAFNGAAGGFNNILADVNGNEILKLQGVAGAVNEISLVNAATGSVPTFSATGGDANIDISILPKGTGAVRIDNDTDPVVVRLYGAIGGYNSILQDFNSNETIGIKGVATAVNYLGVTNSATGNPAILEALGDDANVGLTILAKGTGSVTIDNGTDPVLLKLNGAQAGYNSIISDVNGNELLKFQGVATAVNELGVTNAVTGSRPAIVASGNDVNIDIGLSPKGTAFVDFMYAATALGGGVAPTLGTIGGSGPATAAQNAWLEVKIQGVASWIPFWR